MVAVGYSLSSEELNPHDLVRCAKRAEEIGFPFGLISDHFHPWIDRQGQSPFVWSVIGAIAQATERLRLGTGVTCPILRYHPAIIAQAAATAAVMMNGRFFLGVGAGENLNEHVVGEGWPPIEIRHEMLEEAIEIMRLLWQGGTQSYYGSYYDVENARLYTLPEHAPPLMVAASGEKAAELAGRLGDGLISTSPDKEVVQAFEGAGGKGKPRYAQMTVCVARDESEARRIAHEWWPTAGLKGELSSELALPKHFEDASSLVKPEDVAKSIVCSADPKLHIARIQEYAEAGFDHVYVHQVGDDQEAFFALYQREVLPKFRS